MKQFTIMIFAFFLTQLVFSKQDTCIKLRSFKKKCRKQPNAKVHITCGGRWYQYWTDEYEMQLSRGEKEENIPDAIKPGMCVQVKYETMTMNCQDFLDYRVSLFFCRKQKKRICRKLRQDGFGSLTYKWPKKRKEKRRCGQSHRPYKKKQGYIVKPCSEVIK